MNISKEWITPWVKIELTKGEVIRSDVDFEIITTDLENLPTKNTNGKITKKFAVLKDTAGFIRFHNVLDVITHE